MKHVQLSKVRLPADLHAKLKASAAKSGRTLSGEIAARLLSSYEPDRTRDIIEMTLSAWQAKRMPMGALGAASGLAQQAIGFANHYSGVGLANQLGLAWNGARPPNPPSLGYYDAG